MSNSDPVIPVWLRDIYAKVEPYPLLDVEGLEEVSKDTEQLAALELQKLLPKTSLFIRGSDLYSYLSRYITADMCNHVITFVIVSLRDLYWNMRLNLSIQQQAQLDMVMNKRAPQFQNIFDYPLLQDLGPEVPTHLYQLIGDITPFNVVHVSVRDFINAVNNKLPIPVWLPELAIIIQLSYEEADFWDTQVGQLIDYIPIDCGT
jgi:hypothetical protein